MTKLTRLVLLAVAVVATLYGGRKGTVTYPRTDPTASYLIDAGSYVTNDLVHVNFTRVIIPDSASLFIDRREVAATNDPSAWVTHLTTTFAQFQVPQDIPYQNATNFDWVIYTDWTPGPSVQTNGVWHAMFGLDRKTGQHIIPVRSCIRLDGDVIATPKSKEDNR